MASPASSEFLKSIFGTFSGGLSLFTNSNPFRKKSVESSHHSGKASKQGGDDAHAAEKKKKLDKHEDPNENSGVASTKNRPTVRFEGVDAHPSSFKREKADPRRLFPENELAESRKRARIAEVGDEERPLQDDSLERLIKKKKKKKADTEEAAACHDPLPLSGEDSLLPETQQAIPRSKGKQGKRELEAQDEGVSLKRRRVEVQAPEVSLKIAERRIKSQDQLGERVAAKRKKSDKIEERYEKRLRRGLSHSHTSDQELPVIADNTVKVATSESRKRKRSTDDDQTANVQGFDDEDKLRRTIFVGNLPLKVKKKGLSKEFSQYGRVESVRLRSVPLLDTKIPRKGAVIKGKINEAIESQHAYIVFEDSMSANAALAHNMKEFNGNHLRVDVAHAPRGASKGKSPLVYDPTRSVFVGNVPFDVKDEELYEVFGSAMESPDMGVEAIRVVRDPQTSLSKGIAFVLFKTKGGARRVLTASRSFKLRDKALRVSRISTNQNKGGPAKRMRVSEPQEAGSSKKRAKLSASYEGVRALKDTNRKASRPTGSKDSSGSRSTTPKRPAANGGGSVLGQKRKRVEKKQRGISRSKKIRRS